MTRPRRCRPSARVPRAPRGALASRKVFDIPMITVYIDDQMAALLPHLLAPTQALARQHLTCCFSETWAGCLSAGLIEAGSQAQRAVLPCRRRPMDLSAGLIEAGSQALEYQDRLVPWPPVLSAGLIEAGSQARFILCCFKKRIRKLSAGLIEAGSQAPAYRRARAFRR